MRNKKLLDAVTQAMEIEKETFDFYSAAERKTFNPAGKRIFRWLAKSEELHYLMMVELYRSLKDDGRWLSYGGSTIGLELAGEGEPVVPFDADDRKGLEIALEIEKKALAHFEELEANCSDSQGKEMFRTLILEEKEHGRLVMEKYGFLNCEW